MHTATVARTLEHLGSQVLADLDGNPPLYVTRKRTGKQEDIYINHAKILRSRSNVQLQNKHGKKQVQTIICFLSILLLESCGLMCVFAIRNNNK